MPYKSKGEVVRLHALKAYEDVEVNVYSFLTQL